MLDRASKTFFHLIAQSQTLKKLASRYGMRKPSSFARRFIAGETVAEAIEAARAVEARGMAVTLDLLGESVTNLETADAATRDYIAVIDAMVAAGVGRNISLKLTQLGLDVDKASAIDNLRKILERAEPAGFFVRIDMENSPYTEVTLEIFETLWRHGYRHVGVVLQSALYRSEQDLRTVNALGGRVRLVKGAYKEPKAVAHQKKADVDAAYARMLKTLLVEGHDPAIATHDPSMIELARQIAREHAIAPDGFEFQMLYGVRRDLQAMLVTAGYRVRVYIPFGREWFPYFMRRLGERPANVMFVIRGILGESG
jgi:proline dehydrogenase